MRHPNRRSFAIGQMLALIVAVLVFATPASAQFGGLKKKLKGDAVNKAVDKAVDGAAGGDSANAPTEAGAAASTAGGAGPTAKAVGGPNPATPESTGGMLVLTPDVVDRLLTGLKAGKAEREAAKKKDTPYGRYFKAQAAYEAAKPKCEAAQAAYPNRMATDEKLQAKSQRLLDQMGEIQGDTAATRVWGDSMLALYDASCLVKQPQQPNDYWDAQRAIDSAAEQATLKAGDFTAAEFGQASDRAIQILSGEDPAGGASPSEKAAVNAKGAELKPLLGIRDAQAARVSKAAPAPTPAPVADSAPAAPTPVVPAGADAMSACMSRNIQKHEAEVRALGQRGEAAKQAGNMEALMAIADTLNRIQMAGCTGDR